MGSDFISTILIYTMDTVLKQARTLNKLYASATIAFSEKVMHMRQTAKQKLFSRSISLRYDSSQIVVCWPIFSP